MQEFHLLKEFLKQFADVPSTLARRRIADVWPLGQGIETDNNIRIPNLSRLKWTQSSNPSTADQIHTVHCRNSREKSPGGIMSEIITSLVKNLS